MATDVTASRPGGTFDAQTVNAALFVPKPRDALFARSRFVPIYARDGVARYDQGGNFELTPNAKVWDMSEIYAVLSLRICSGKDTNNSNLPDNAIVRIYHPLARHVGEATIAYNTLFFA
jgi:hypothetical protein